MEAILYNGGEDRGVNLIANGRCDPELGGCGGDVPVAAEEDFVKGVYASVDEVTTRGLERLCREEGISVSCRPGCCHCCRHHILVNVAEARTLAQYVRRELSVDQMDALQMRTRQWHEWDDSRPGRPGSGGAAGRTDLTRYDPCCPLLVKGVCLAYPVRPIVCRTHFVRSDPLSCRATNDPESTEDPPVVLTPIVQAGRPFALALRHHIENSGSDFSRSILLLPQGLARQMDWDFAVAL